MSDWLCEQCIKEIERTHGQAACVEICPKCCVRDVAIYLHQNRDLGEPMIVSFESALTMLKKNKKMSRLGWNGPGQHVEMVTPDLLSNISRPYLCIQNAQGDRLPWLPSQMDILATDWVEMD